MPHLLRLHPKKDELIFLQKNRAVATLDRARPLAQNVVKELESAIARTKSDAETLRKARDAL
jgi:hypothetical protein